MWFVDLVQKGPERVIQEMTQSNPIDLKVIKEWESRKKQCEIFSMASGVSFAASLVSILKKDASPLSRKASSLIALASLVILVVGHILGGRCAAVCARLKIIPVGTSPKPAKGLSQEAGVPPGLGLVPEETPPTPEKVFPPESEPLRKLVNEWNGSSQLDLSTIDPDMLKKIGDYFTTKEKVAHVTKCRNSSSLGNLLFITQRQLKSVNEIAFGSDVVDSNKIKQLSQSTISPFFVDLVCSVNSVDPEWVRFTLTHFNPNFELPSDISKVPSDKRIYKEDLKSWIIGCYVDGWDQPAIEKKVGEQYDKIYLFRSTLESVCTSLGQFYWTLPIDKRDSVMKGIIEKLHVNLSDESKQMADLLQSITFEVICGQIVSGLMGKWLLANDNEINQYESKISELVPGLDIELFSSNMEEIMRTTNDGYISLDFSSAYTKLHNFKRAIGLNDLRGDQWSGRYNICDFYASKILQNPLERNIVAAFKQKMAVDFFADQFRVTTEQLESIKAKIETLDPEDPDKATLLGVVKKLLSPELAGPAELGTKGGEVVEAV